MAGISSKALAFGDPQNKEQTFQEQRFDDDLGVNFIQFKYRSHDPQIGRFMQIDPLADDYRYNSTYAFSENRVTDGRELEGLEYVSIHHYANGTNVIKMHYKSTDKEINKINGTTAGPYNAASYGPQGKGVVHYYYNREGQVYNTTWDNKREDFATKAANHGLYSGPGCITDRNGNYDFSYQPIDWADAIAKRHDMDYAKATASGGDLGYIEDTRTYQADVDMINRVDALAAVINNPFKKNYVEGVETPFRTSSSGEMLVALVGQKVVIGALANYKKWKIDNGYTGKEHTFKKLASEYAEYDKINAAIIAILSSNKDK